MSGPYTDGSGAAETPTLADVQETFDHVRGPVVLSRDVADRFECSTRTARRRLEELRDRGEVGRRKVARRNLYWLADDGPTGTGGSATGERDRPDDRSRTAEKSASEVLAEVSDILGNAEEVEDAAKEMGIEDEGTGTDHE